MNIKKIFLVGLLGGLFVSAHSQSFKQGDMIFHTSKSEQSNLIKYLTKSNLTHCGVIFYKNGKAFVMESVQPVKVTPLNDFINRGVGRKYKVTRLKQELTKNSIDAMYSYGKRQVGKSYDAKFGWSDSKMYCSELVWKIFFAGGHELTTPKYFSDYDINNPNVKKVIKQRFKGDFSKDMPVVSPVDLFNSSLVNLVFSNY